MDIPINHRKFSLCVDILNVKHMSNDLKTVYQRSPNSEINGFKGSYSPVSNDSFGDRETIIIRLTRQKPFSSPLRSPVAYNCTPDSQLRSIDSSGVWDFLQSPSCTTTAAFSSSSSGISSCSELFVAEDKGNLT